MPWPQDQLAPDLVWPFSTGAGQRVAVVGSGVAATGQLAGAVAEAADLAPPPEPFSPEPSGEADCRGIGTGVAGIVAGRPRDGVGFHGMAPDADILSAKVVGDQFPADREPAGSVAPDPLAAALDWAVERGATVIVVPTITYQDSGALRAAVRRAVQTAVVIAPVGEPAQDEPPDLVPYPAGYDGVVGVGAIAEDGAAGSRAGRVDLVAPGDGLLTSYPDGGLGRAEGSAFAAGYVAGAAALVRGYRPELPPAAVVRRLLATATPAPEGVGSPAYGYGIVNPYQAVLDRLADRDPVPHPSITPAVLSDAQRARLADRARSDALASGLAVAGLALAAGIAATAALGRSGRLRRWRAGLADPPPVRTRDDRPEPPVELFDRPTDPDRPK